MVVGPRASLERTTLTASGVNWILDEPDQAIPVTAQIRHRHQPATATVRALPDHPRRGRLRRAADRDHTRSGGGVLRRRCGRGRRLDRLACSGNFGIQKACEFANACRSVTELKAHRLPPYAIPNSKFEILELRERSLPPSWTHRSVIRSSPQAWAPSAACRSASRESADRARSLRGGSPNRTPSTPEN